MPRAERLAVLGLMVAMAVSAITLLVLSRDLAFWSDELDWLTFGDDFAPGTLLTPHNSHLIGLPRVIYEVLPRIFGAEYLPFRLVSIAAVLACAALFFVLARRRIGGPLALAPTLVLLFFGSSSEVVLSPLGLPISLSVAFGLATFVALERETPGWDVAALVFLVLSVLSDTFGAIIAGGVLLYLLLDPERRRRLWVALVPLLLYVAWWVWARKFDQDIVTASNLSGVPSFVLESAAATLGALTGIGKSFGSSSDSLETVVQAVFIAIALVGTALLVIRARRVGSTAALWAFALTLLAFWVAIALSESDVRQPSTPRYLLFASIMVLLVFAEAYRGERPRGRIAAAIVGVAFICLCGNAARLIHNSDGLADRAAVVQTQLAMIDIAGGEANPTFSPSSIEPRGTGNIVAGAAPLNRFMDEYGTLGFSIAEVKQQPNALREDGDAVLAGAVGANATAIPSSTPMEGFDCGPVEGTFEVPPGISIVELSEGDPVPLLVRRFGDRPSVDIGSVTSDGPSAVGLAVDDETGIPWVGELASPAELCSQGDAEAAP